MIHAGYGTIISENREERCIYTMVNTRLTTRKKNKMYRTAGNIIERQGMNTSAGIPAAMATAIGIHSKKKNYRGKYRPKR
jgi:hypothetical protein